MLRLRLIIGIFIFIIPEVCLAQNSDISYSFFVAGHTYGKPGVDNIGLHPPFVGKFSYITSRPEIQLGVLTGDIVFRGSEEDWDEVDAQIDSLGIPVYFTPGNHDLSDRALFERRYGITYSYFLKEQDLFILLDPNLDSWNISGAQLDFLKTTLNSQAPTADHIFVFFHQMIWWAPDNIYKDLVSNSLEGRAAITNFWTEVEPLFRILNKPVFLYAGDIGAGDWAEDIVYDQYGKMHLIASGMGEGPGDNFVVTNIHADLSVSFDVICLNSPVLDCLGELTSYRISTGIPGMEYPTGIKIYPNPAEEVLTLSVPDWEPCSIEILDPLGRKIREQQFQSGEPLEIPVSDLSKGLYFLKYSSKRIQGIERFIH